MARGGGLGSAFRLAIAVGLILLIGACGGGSSSSGVALIRADVTVAEANNIIAALAGDPDFVILDVRTAAECAVARLENSTNIDFYAADFLDLIDALDRDGVYLVYCKAGARSATACDEMNRLDFAEVYNMLGGIDAWMDAGYPTVP
jgi:rhodanese-related sulfurtransferase